MEPTVRIPSAAPSHVRLPPELEGLRRLAYNLYWSWHPQARALFARINGGVWARVHSPIPVLTSMVDWPALLQLRRDVMRELEKLRVAGAIGAPLDAEVDIYCVPAEFDRFNALGEELRFLAFCASMRRLAHGQILQDLWVLYELDLRPGGYFVEFGAYDGSVHSNTKLLEERLGWTGLRNRQLEKPDGAFDQARGHGTITAELNSALPRQRHLLGLHGKQRPQLGFTLRLRNIGQLAQPGFEAVVVEGDAVELGIAVDQLGVAIDRDVGLDAALGHDQVNLLGPRVQVQLAGDHCAGKRHHPCRERRRGEAREDGVAEHGTALGVEAAAVDHEGAADTRGAGSSRVSGTSVAVDGAVVEAIVAVIGPLPTPA